MGPRGTQNSFPLPGVEVAEGEKTMARGVRLLAEITSPGRVMELRDIETRTIAWEENMTRSESFYKEKVSEGMRLAIFTNMMLFAIQEIIYTSVADGMTYRNVRDKVRAIVSNKMSMNMGPSPMEIGWLQQQTQEEEAKQPEGDWWNVDAVGAHTQCFKCKGYGRMSRECPKGKGKGKSGGKTGSKAGGKGWSKGASKGGKHSTTREGKQICFAFAIGDRGGCADSCLQNRAHVCEICLQPHRNAACSKKA